MSIRDWLEATAARQAFENLGVGVSVHDGTGALVYLNPVGIELLGWTGPADCPLHEFATRLNVQPPPAQRGGAAELPVAQVLGGREPVDTELSVRLPSGMRRQLRVIARRALNAQNHVAGVVLTFLDYGEAASARGAVRDLVEQSTPVLNVGNKLLLQPLIGTLDSQRAAQAMEKLLETVGVTGSKVAIVDITGVSAVDTATANHLLRSLTAARLLGCEVVLSGVSPPIARTITLLGLDLSALRTKRDVAAAIEWGRRWVEATEVLPAGDATPGGHGSDGTQISSPQSPPSAAEKPTGAA